MRILKDSDANMVGKIKQVVDRVADKVIACWIVLCILGKTSADDILIFFLNFSRK